MIEQYRSLLEGVEKADKRKPYHSATFSNTERFAKICEKFGDYFDNQTMPMSDEKFDKLLRDVAEIRQLREYIVKAPKDFFTESQIQKMVEEFPNTQKHLLLQRDDLSEKQIETILLEVKAYKGVKAQDLFAMFDNDEETVKRIANCYIHSTNLNLKEENFAPLRYTDDAMAIAEAYHIACKLMDEPNPEEAIPWDEWQPQDAPKIFTMLFNNPETGELMLDEITWRYFDPLKAKTPMPESQDFEKMVYFGLVDKVFYLDKEHNDADLIVDNIFRTHLRHFPDSCITDLIERVENAIEHKENIAAVIPILSTLARHTKDETVFQKLMQLNLNNITGWGLSNPHIHITEEMYEGLKPCLPSMAQRRLFFKMAAQNPILKRKHCNQYIDGANYEKNLAKGILLTPEFRETTYKSIIKDIQEINDVEINGIIDLREAMFENAYKVDRKMEPFFNTFVISLMDANSFCKPNDMPYLRTIEQNYIFQDEKSLEEIKSAVDRITESRSVNSQFKKKLKSHMANYDRKANISAEILNKFKALVATEEEYGHYFHLDVEKLLYMNPTEIQELTEQARSLSVDAANSLRFCIENDIRQFCSSDRIGGISLIYKAAPIYTALEREIEKEKIIEENNKKIENEI